jgi:hypothetical protein
MLAHPPTSTLRKPALTVDMPAHLQTVYKLLLQTLQELMHVRHASTPSHQHPAKASTDCRHASTPADSLQALAAITAGPHACLRAMPAHSPASTLCMPAPFARQH